jgi:predicted site-specific integrase-resolvase
VENDIVKDMISIITSFCSRLYGARRGSKKINLIKKIIKEEND